ncbi:MAG: hypothetical protein JOZ46_02695 [Candidatus Dormibacteraeota bacterium]|nr:hypothetical protein [Candidatus Dormibacteraeota bacterium]MBV9524707.1 hypothetical protein [Candidatus Dormibacteraeota bacterium]
MTPEVLCAVTAAARAAAFIDDASAAERDLEPPHPAFVGFRRLAYIWVEAGSWQPVGDRIGIWLDFLRGRGVTAVRLDLQGEDAVVWTLRGDAADAWRIGDTGEQMSLRGSGDTMRRMRDDTVDAAARALRDAITGRLGAGPEQLQREELERALAILDSPADGSEVSDVAWPYFVLPERGYGVDARRLVGAAASAWAGLGDPWPESARRAVAAAVNSIASARAAAPTSGEPVQ